MKTYRFTACVGITIYASVEAESEADARKQVEEYPMGSITDCEEESNAVWHAEELDGEASYITLEGQWEPK